MRKIQNIPILQDTPGHPILPIPHCFVCKFYLHFIMQAFDASRDRQGWDTTAWGDYHIKHSSESWCLSVIKELEPRVERLKKSRSGYDERTLSIISQYEGAKDALHVMRAERERKTVPGNTSDEKKPLPVHVTNEVARRAGVRSVTNTALFRANPAVVRNTELMIEIGKEKTADDLSIFSKKMETLIHTKDTLVRTTDDAAAAGKELVGMSFQKKNKARRQKFADIISSVPLTTEIADRDAFLHNYESFVSQRRLTCEKLSYAALFPHLVKEQAQRLVHLIRNPGVPVSVIEHRSCAPLKALKEVPRLRDVVRSIRTEIDALISAMRDTRAATTLWQYNNISSFPVALFTSGLRGSQCVPLHVIPLPDKSWTPWMYTSREAMVAAKTFNKPEVDSTTVSGAATLIEYQQAENEILIVEKTAFLSKIEQAQKSRSEFLARVVEFEKSETRRLFIYVGLTSSIMNIGHMREAAAQFYGLDDATRAASPSVLDHETLPYTRWVEVSAYKSDNIRLGLGRT